MRYAVMADIHGNMPAFRAVLADAAACGAQEYIFLGDYCNHLSGSREVVEVLCHMPNTYIIKGNEDDHILQLRTQDQSTWTDGQFCTTYWTFRRFEPEQLDFLASLPEEIQIPLAGGLVADCFHAPGYRFPDTALAQMSPAEFTSVVEEALAEQSMTIERYATQIGARAQKDEAFCTILQQQPAQIFLFAHSHMQFSLEIADKLLLNPGSVGIPLDDKDRAAYTILDCSDGDYRIEHRRVPYDVAEIIAHMHTSGMYAAAPIWSEILEEQVCTNRTRSTFFLRHMVQFAADRGDTTRPYTKETFAAGYADWRANGPYPAKAWRKNP